MEQNRESRKLHVRWKVTCQAEVSKLQGLESTVVKESCLDFRQSTVFATSKVGGGWCVVLYAL